MKGHTGPIRLETSEVFTPMFDANPDLRALARAHDRIADARRLTVDLQAALEDYGHYLPLLHRRRFSRGLAELYDGLMGIRRDVLIPLDRAMGDD